MIALYIVTDSTPDTLNSNQICSLIASHSRMTRALQQYKVRCVLTDDYTYHDLKSSLFFLSL